MKTTTLLGSLFMGAMILGLSSVGQAQPELGRPGNNQYAVKIVCGNVPRAGGPLAVGQYFTAVNVHNPGRGKVDYVKKLALANPGEKPGMVSKPVRGTLGPDEAMETDCRELAKIGEVPPGALFGGYLVIETEKGNDLDVVAVYTAQGTAGVSAFHTERVPRRVLP